MKPNRHTIPLSIVATALLLAGVATPAAAGTHEPAPAPSGEHKGLAQALNLVTIPVDATWELAPSVEVTARPPKAVPAIVQRQQYDNDLRAAGAVVSDEGWVHPLPAGRPSSTYGRRAPIPALGYPATFHRGFDLAADAGTPVRVAFDGEVVYAGHGHASRDLSGWVVIVRHPGGVETSYNHMFASGVHVSAGQQVTRGDVIVSVGNAGNSTGPHLHLGVWVNGADVNPEPFFAERGITLR